ncbi:MAG: Bug family tripartite tricarboxylate transporter substrate binding protein [Burkholderiales bacterium]
MTKILKSDVLRRVIPAALLALGLCAVASIGAAQQRNFPEHGVRVVVPYAPSGAVDIAARLLAKELAELWGQPVVVDNRPGAAGVIAADLVAKSAPDGYMLLLADDGLLTTVPLFNDKMPYDTLNDLVSIALVGMFPHVVITSASLKVKSMAELVAAAQAKPGMINYATNGIGGTHHLTWERLQRAANIKLNHVPYKGAAPALQDVLAGHVPMMLAAVATAFPYIKDGRLVPIATGGPTRAPLLPELPTLIESGFPGFEVVSWMGVLAAKGTPPALVERISRDLGKVTQSEAYQSGLAQRGTEARTSTPQVLAERIREELKRNEILVKSLSIKTN